MAQPRRSKGRDDQAQTSAVIRRPKDQRKKLPPQLEAFARGDKNALRRHRPPEDSSPPDPNEAGRTIPGVSNRDARAVLDARVTRLRAHLRRHTEDPASERLLSRELAEAIRLRLWRARRITSFEAFVEELVGMKQADAEALLDRHGDSLDEALEPLSERLTTTWLNAEASLIANRVHASVAIESNGELRVTTTFEDAYAAFSTLARRMARGAPPRAPRSNEPRRTPRR